MVHTGHVASTLARLDQRLTLLTIVADPAVLAVEEGLVLAGGGGAGAGSRLALVLLAILLLPLLLVKVETGEEFARIQDPEFGGRHTVPQDTWEPEGDTYLYHAEH